MPSDKKITKEDTWRPADLRRHIREEEHGDGYVRRPADNERRHRGGESTERNDRNAERELGRDRERVRESTRERDKKDRYVDQRKEGSQDRRGDRERDRRDEQEREKRRERDRLGDENRYNDNFRENRDKRRDREDKYDREGDRERHRDKDKEKTRDRHNEEKERARDRHREEDRDKRREDMDKERRREERDKEHRSERRKHEDIADGRREQTEKQTRDRHHERERHKNDYEDKRNDKEFQQRHRDRKHSEWREERDYKEEHQKRKEERERRHKERGHQDEKQKHDSRQHRDLTGEDVRRYHGDREKRHREEEDRERQHRETRHGEEDGDRKRRERRHREEEDRERKHRERRHREKERNHRDRTSSKKSSSDKSHKPEYNMAEKEGVEMVSEQTASNVKDEGHREEPVVNDEDWANQEYEDDFEDYEEDFEEVDESASEGDQEPVQPVMGEEKKELTAQQRKELEAIQRAMDEENERVGTAHARRSMSREEEDWHSKDTEKSHSRASRRGKFIDFVAAKHREVSKKVATKQKKRSTELLRLIDLDFSLTFSLLDLPPVNEYDMYIRSFGAANTKQAYVQCNEDNTERDIQTDEIEMCEKWTQHPPEHNGACGDPNLSQEARDRTINHMNFDSQRLTSFLRSASQVMVVLLEEDRAERKSLRKLRTQTDMPSFSDGSLQLNTKIPFLFGRQISLVHFSQVQRHTMMSVHMPKTKASDVRFDSCTLICIWNIWEPSRPQKILIYESEVQCCCFSPGKAILVFAGTSVGSVVLWDLREHASNHDHLKIEEDDWTFRHPTFSTDAVMAASGHFSSVTSVEVVPSTVAGGPEVPLLASEEESSGLSFQLASLDESGVLNFWVVLELPKGNEAGSSTDLGLWPGGRVKLLHSSSLLTAERVSPRDVVKTRPSQTLLLKFLPTDSNHFFIGTNMGLVNHGTTHGLKAPPKFYRFQEAVVRPVDVSSIHFSPSRQHLFLVGCANGSIRLHAVSHEQPVAEWRNSTAGESVLSLQWSQTRPTVFCVLDAASNLHIWDLLKNDTQPVVTERISDDRVTAMAAFGDSGQQNTYSGIVLAHESGKIEIHYFTRSFTASTSAEEEKLESLMAVAF